MDHGIHFHTGIPRSGHSLLGAILKQNPKFFTWPSSPLAAMIRTMLPQMGAQSDYVSMFDDDKRRAILRGMFDGYYHAIHPIQTPLDTNGSWCAFLPIIADLFPQAKIIAMARDLAWVLDSCELLLRRNPLQLARIFADREESVNVYARVQGMLAWGGFVGYGWSSTMEVFHGPLSHKMIMVDYETLCRWPEWTLVNLYNALGMPPFAHHFTNLQWPGGGEFDIRTGTPTLHAVRPNVEWKPREKSVLPPDLFQRYTNSMYWRRPHDSKCRVIVAPPLMEVFNTRRQVRAGSEAAARPGYLVQEPAPAPAPAPPLAVGSARAPGPH